MAIKPRTRHSKAEPLSGYGTACRVSVPTVRKDGVLAVFKSSRATKTAASPSLGPDARQSRRPCCFFPARRGAKWPVSPCAVPTGAKDGAVVDFPCRQYCSRARSDRQPSHATNSSHGKKIGNLNMGNPMRIPQAIDNAATFPLTSPPAVLVFNPLQSVL